MSRVRERGSAARRAGPLRTFGVGGVPALLSAALLVLGCAGRSPAPAPTGTPDRVEEPDDRSPGARQLDDIEGLVAAGEYARASRLADSLYYRWRDGPGTGSEAAAGALLRGARALAEGGDLREAAGRLEEHLREFPGVESREAAARLLAPLRIRLARDPAAVRVLTRVFPDPGREAQSLLREAAAGMSATELRGSLAGLSGDAPVRHILLAALARSLARGGLSDSARQVAAAALRAGAAGADAEAARSVAAGELSRRPGPVVVGALLPLSGRLESVGSSLREGMRLALRESGTVEGREVTLRVLDARGSEPGGTVALVRRLEEEGAVAVIGPLRSRELRVVAGGRQDPGLLVISPTSTEAVRATAAYTLWSLERRKLDAARTLGVWAGREMGDRPGGALYPEGELGRRSYLAFRQAMGRAGGYVSAAASYSSGSQTFEEPISAVGAFGPGVVFVAADRQPAVLQIAPQLSYYGLQGAVVLGDPAWAGPETVRRLEPVVSQFRIVGAYGDRGDPASGWSAFEAMYESEYRKSLGNNVLPALGYDAAKLVLHALEEAGAGFGGPRPVARRFAGLRGIEGATGTIIPDPESGSAEREIRVRAIRDRALAPVQSAEVRSWLERVRAVEAAGLRRRRGAAREAVERWSRAREEEREEGGR